MSKRLVTFGDSWTAGHCSDLVEAGLVTDLSNVTTIKNFHDESLVFKTPWPNLVASKLGLDVKNYALPGMSNKNIVAQLYDSLVFSDLDSDNDIVIVLLSTWHRGSEWDGLCVGKTGRSIFNRFYFPRTSSFFKPQQPKVTDGLVDIDQSNLEKKSYDAFFDYFSVVNCLKAAGIKNYFIGWAFTQIDDFAVNISKEYKEEILNNTQLLEPFVNFCKIIDYMNLLHPTLEDHNSYADYVVNKIKGYHVHG